MIRSARCTVSWSRALGSYECGSCPADDTIAVTSTASPPISSAICAYTSVDATTVMRSPDAAASESEEAQPASSRADAATSATGAARRRGVTSPPTAIDNRSQISRCDRRERGISGATGASADRPGSARPTPHQSDTVRQASLTMSNASGVHSQSSSPSSRPTASRLSRRRSMRGWSTGYPRGAVRSASAFISVKPVRSHRRQHLIEPSGESRVVDDLAEARESRQAARRTRRRRRAARRRSAADSGRPAHG